MPKSPYRLVVNLLQSYDPNMRSSGLATLSGMVFSDPPLASSQQLEMVQAPLLLESLASFLSLTADPSLATSTLELLCELAKGLEAEKRECKAAIYDSQVFLNLLSLLPPSSPLPSLPLQQWAWSLVTTLSAVRDELKLELFSSHGMPLLLQAGVESTDDYASEEAVRTLANLCSYEEVASAVLDEHPELVRALVGALTRSGVPRDFKFCRKCFVQVICTILSLSPLN